MCGWRSPSSDPIAPESLRGLPFVGQWEIDRVSSGVLASEGKNHIQLQREYGVAVVEWLRHPTLEGEMVVDEVDEARTSHPLFLIVNLNQVTA